MASTIPTRAYQIPSSSRLWFVEPWRSSQAAPDLLLGLGLGCALPALVATVLWVAGVIRLTPSGLATVMLLATFASAVVMTPLLEEIVFRYLLFRGVETLCGSWVALAATGVLFGAAHLMLSAPESLVQGGLVVAAGTLAGTFFAAGYMATRTLWLPIGLHAGWKLAPSLVICPQLHGANRVLWLTSYGAPVWSGGAFGTDASILTSGVLLIAAVALLRQAWCKHQLVAFNVDKST